MAKRKNKKRDQAAADRGSRRAAELDVRKTCGRFRSNILNPDKSRRKERRESKLGIQKDKK